ncbi:MAG: thioredoxin-like domain-containing protein, partial [Planctomycetota bacterium]
LKIEERIDGLMQRVLEKQITHRFTFDRSEGRVTHIEGEIASLWGSTLGNGTLSLTLDTVAQLETEALSTRDRDSKEYSSVVAQLRAAIRAATYGAEGWEETMAAAQKRIAAAAEAVTEERLKSKLAELVRVFDYQMQISPQRWGARKARLGQPGPKWTRKEFTGRERSSDETLGQITVLSFWNRPNTWSMRILPEIPKLMQRYAGKSVTFLSMNNDRFRADAEFVLGLIDLPIPTVEAAGLSEQYGIRAFPAVVVIAPDGTIHDYHEGYNPNLLDDVTGNIDDLLKAMESAEKPEKTSEESSGGD